MPISLLEGSLLGIDVALFALAGTGYLLLRSLGPGVVPDARAAFELLDRSIKRYAPELPQGYTWTEAFEHLREKGVKSDWRKMDEKLSEYEAFRYGSNAALPRDGTDVAGLAMKLRRNPIDRRAKGEDTRAG
ncbi:MAG: hypothetical protein JRN21_02760 [Nitrososphaerota archaeon]|nr:hypothetical protein [Nitrososphaerota archaeon]